MSWIKNDNGLELSDTNDILESMRNVWTGAFPSLNTSPSTPQGQIITAETEILTEAQRDIAEFANLFFNGGTGKWLDIRNKNFYGITRRSATRGYVTAKVMGVVGTVIPSGFKAEGAGHKFTSRYSYTINNGGYANMELFADEAGKFQIQAGELTEILTPIQGVERITNLSPSIEGTDAETDAEFRLRATESIHFNSTGLFSGLLAQLMEVDGVTAVGGYENTSSQTITYKGVEMLPHSINTIVKGGDRNEIGRVMLQRKNPGCYTGGDIEVGVLEEISGQIYQMRFYRPTECLLSAYVSVKTGANVSEDFVEQVKQQLSEYVSSIKFGTEIYPFQAVSSIKVNDLEVVDFKLGRKNDTLGYGIIDLSFLEEPVLNTEDITVVSNGY